MNFVLVCLIQPNETFLIVLNSIVFSALAKEIIFPKLIDLAPLLVELEIT